MAWTIYLLILTAAYCIARAIDDFRKRRIVWGALGILAALAILTMPFPTHAVKVDLPVAGR